MKYYRNNGLRVLHRTDNCSIKLTTHLLIDLILVMKLLDRKLRFNVNTSAYTFRATK